jgi:hypothetical protein
MRPLARRRAMVRRPALDAMRARKPILRRRGRRFGWNVLFIRLHPRLLRGATEGLRLQPELLINTVHRSRSQARKSENRALALRLRDRPRRRYYIRKPPAPQATVPLRPAGWTAGRCARGVRGNPRSVILRV